MELIFENVEERDEFFVDSSTCPSYIGGRDFKGNMCCQENCARCWEQSGLKYRVKPQVTIECSKPLDKKLERELVKQIEKYTNQPTPDHPVPIEEQTGSITEIVINEPLRPGDRLVKKDGKWCIEKRPEGWWKNNPYLKVDIPKPDITPNEHWMDKKIEDYIREVTRGDIQMFVMPGRAQGRTEIRRRMEEAQQRLIMENSVFGVSGPVSTYSVLCKLNYEYRNNKNWKEALDIFMDKHNRIKKPQIKDIIWNGPATIVFWKDGTKTVVKCADCDVPNYEKGLAMAICKKVYGEGYWSGVFKKWVSEKKVRSLADAINEMHDHITMAFGVPTKILEDLPHAPNPLCGRVLVAEPIKPCEECKHADVHEFEEPCRSCSGNSKFEEKEVEKLCCNCQWYNEKHDLHRPCAGCVEIDFGNWKVLHNHFKPKDAK
jgi:hypothetical protein